MADTWYAEVAVDPAGTWSEGSGLPLFLALHEHDGVRCGQIRVSDNNGAVVLTLQVDADGLVAANTLVLAAVGDVLPGGMTLRAVRVLSEEEMRRPCEQHLVGFAEAQDVLGVSKQRVDQLVKGDPRFPKPVARLRSGPAWTWDSVAWYGDERATAAAR